MWYGFVSQNNTLLAKNIVIGATQMSGHSLKLHFCMFERSQGLKDYKRNIIVWTIINFFGIFSISYKFYMFKAWHISKMFLYVQSTQTLKMNKFYFFQMSFFSTKCAPFLLKIGEDFNIDNYTSKRIWINENCLHNQF
jgi:hypothetical protein